MLRVLGIVYPVLIALSIVQIAVSFLTAERTAGHALYPRHSGGKLAVFQFRCIVLPGPVVCGRLQAQNCKEPLHPCTASILLVCSDCRSVYDSILSVLRPVPVRTFKTDDCSRNKG